MNSLATLADDAVVDAAASTAAAAASTSGGGGPVDMLASAFESFLTVRGEAGTSPVRRQKPLEGGGGAEGARNRHILAPGCPHTLLCPPSVPCSPPSVHT